PVVEVSRDPPVGAVLQAADLAPASRAEAPDGALADPAQAVGRTLAGGARSRALLTDVPTGRPVGPQPGPGRVAVPIRPADGTVTELLRPGMHVAVVSVTDDGFATLLATDAAVPRVRTARR